MRVAQSDKVHQPTDDGTSERIADLGRRVIVAIDGPALARALDADEIVHSTKEPDVIDLRDASREELDRSGGDKPIVILAECRE